MLHKYRFEYEAFCEVDKIAKDYERGKPSKGDAFEADLFNVIDLIRESPDMYQVYKKPDVRKVPLKEFPYSILYRFCDNQVEILAVGFNNRNDNYWLERAN